MKFIKILFLIIAISIVAPLIAMHKRTAPASPATSDTDLLAPRTPPTTSYIPGTPLSSESDYVVPGSPEEFDAALLMAELDEEVARRHREQALKQLREEEHRNKAHELAKKKAATQWQRQSKKPKKDS